MQSFQEVDRQVHSLRQQVESTEAQLRDLKVLLQQAEQQSEASRQLEQAWAGGLHEDWINETLAALSPEGQHGGQEHRVEHEQLQLSPSLPRANSTEGRWPLTSEEYKRYGRQLILSEVGLHGQLRLKNARVLIVGAGGLGCPAATYLAGAGVGTLGLMDGDTVEASNLHRQIAHSTYKIGMSKVDSIVDSLSAYVVASYHPCPAGPDSLQSQSPRELPAPYLSPLTHHCHPHLLPVRLGPRLYRQPKLALSHIRHLRLNPKTSRVGLSPEDRRSTNRTQQPTSIAWQPIRRSLLPLRFPQTATS